MNYEKPEVRDFGAIADHTYGYNDGQVLGVFVDSVPNPGGSGPA